jgi:hypothetical protein
MKRLLCAGAAVALLIAPPQVASAKPAEAAAKVSFRNSLRVYDIPAVENPKAARDFFFGDVGAQTVDWGAAEDQQALLDQCAPTSDPRAKGLVGDVLGWIIEPIVKAAMDKIEASLKAELAKYSAEYAATTQVPFYKTENGVTTQRWTCFRMTRTRTTGGTSALAYDLVGQVRMEPGGWLKVRPLRVYFRYPTAKGTKVALSSGLKLDALWRDGAEGRESAVLDLSLLPGKEAVYAVTAKGSGREVAGAKAIYPGVEWSDVRAMQVAPPSSTAPEHTLVTLKVSTAEAGDGPGKKFFEKLLKVFGDVKGDVSDLLIEAGKKLAGG